MKKIFSYAVFILLIFFSVKTGAEVKNLAKFEAGKKYFRQGIKFYNNQQYLAAAELFRNAVMEYPEYYTARDYLARSYKLAGFIDASLKEWEIIGDAYPENAGVRNKIEAIRFIDSLSGAPASYSEYVILNTMRSRDFLRFGFKTPIDIAVDPDKFLYITSFSGGKVSKIDSNGNGILTMQPSMDSKLYGIDISRNKVATTDFAKDTVYIFSDQGKLLKEFGGTGSGEGKFHGAKGVCFDASGNLFVADSGNHRVQKFSEDGNFILKFGSKGEYDEQMNNPSDVVHLKDRVYVTDTDNKRLACYDDSGNFIQNISLKGLAMPRGIAKYNGSLLLSDEKKGLCVYNPETGEQTWPSFWKKEKKENSRLFSTVPDRDGFLYCLDYNHENIYVFSPIQKRYSNLELEITSVDTRQFPVVAFYLNVKNRDGSPQYGLMKENFSITEDSARITNLFSDYLRRKPASASMVLCVDRSEGMKDFHNDMPWAADFILAKMRKNDAIKVMNFNGKTWEGNPFDWSRRRTLRAIGQRGYGKGKDMGTVIYNAISDLVPKMDRRSVIIITDGRVEENSFKKYSRRVITSYAKVHFIPLYFISFKKPDPVLEKIASETGGAVLRPGEVDSLRQVYDRIKGSEEYRYVLVYTTFKIPAFKNWWSDVRIEVNYKAQTGVEWGGYFVP